MKGAKMGRCAVLSSKNTCRVFAGVLLRGLFVACTEVHVAVDTCPTGMGPRIGAQEPQGAGACWQGTAITSAVDAYGAYIAGTTTLIQDHNHKCTSGNKKGGGSCNFIP